MANESQSSPSSLLLEAYLLGRASEMQRHTVEDWLDRQPDALEHLDHIRHEIVQFQAALSANEGEDAQQIDETWFARYLDGELSAEEREALEVLLAGRPALQLRLVELYRAVQAASDPALHIETVEYRPAGERIDWKEERTHRDVMTSEEAKMLRADAPSLDVEATNSSKSRKRRLSPGQS